MIDEGLKHDGYQWYIEKGMMEYDCMHEVSLHIFRDNSTTLVQGIRKKDAVPKISWEHLE